MARHAPGRPAHATRTTTRCTTGRGRVRGQGRQRPVHLAQRGEDHQRPLLSPPAAPSTPSWTSTPGHKQGGVSADHVWPYWMEPWRTPTANAFDRCTRARRRREVKSLHQLRRGHFDANKKLFLHLADDDGKTAGYPDFNAFKAELATHLPTTRFASCCASPCAPVQDDPPALLGINFLGDWQEDTQLQDANPQRGDKASVDLTHPELPLLRPAPKPTPRLRPDAPLTAGRTQPARPPPGDLPQAAPQRPCLAGWPTALERQPSSRHSTLQMSQRDAMSTPAAEQRPPPAARPRWSRRAARLAPSTTGNSTKPSKPPRAEQPTTHSSTSVRRCPW